MKNNIRLSRNHGVNPSVGVCFWCGSDSGELLLLGALPQDAEAPRRMCVNYDPCEKCQAGINLGVWVVEVFDSPNDCPDDRKPLMRTKMEGEAVPTGRWCVMTRDSEFWDSITNDALRTHILHTGHCVMPRAAYEHVGFHTGFEKLPE